MRRKSAILRQGKVSHWGRQSHPNRGSAFTLIELLIVVAIIALLVSILLPSLAAARELTQAAICSSNLHQIYGAASMYGADCDGWIAPTSESFYPRGGTTAYGMLQALSEQMPLPLLNQPYWDDTWMTLTPADFYCGLGYIPFAEQAERRTGGGGDKGAIITNDVLRCPLAMGKLGHVFGIYGGGNGRIQCTYGWSCLTKQYANPYYNPNGARRTNIWGPYRPEELAKPADTCFAADGWTTASNAYYGWSLPPGPSNPCDHAIRRDFQYAAAGEPFLGFGQVFEVEGPLFSDQSWYYHEIGGPIVGFWDGHVETVVPFDAANRYAMRRYLTRNGLPVQANGQMWPL